MNEISFPIAWLKAAQIMAAKIDILYYINGVCIEIMPKEFRIVATDGHKLIIFRTETASEHTGKFIIPNEAIDAIKRKPKITNINFHYGDGVKCSLEYGALEICFKPIDGRFPDYQQAVEAGLVPSKEVAHYNPEYVAQFQKAVKLAYGNRSFNCPTIWPNGDKSGLVTYRNLDSFLGVIMPMRTSDECRAPAWAHTEKKPRS